MEKYIGERSSTRDFTFQELVRILDSTLFQINDDGPTGKNCLKIISFLSGLEGIGISDGLRKVIDEETKKAHEKQNVREHVKKILKYPIEGYLPWVEENVPQTVLSEINDIAKHIRFSIGLKEGKIYALCTSNETLTDVVFSRVNVDSAEKNDESSHVTIVNSNVVHDLGIDNVENFLKSYTDSFTLETGKIKSTFSEDWSRFSTCYVIEIKSPFIEKFLKDFNCRFNTKLRVSPHVTFAIKPRQIILF